MLLLLRHFFFLLTFSFLVLTIDARSIGDCVSSEIADTVIDLNSTSFNSILKSSPASFTIVEFLAHWPGPCAKQLKQPLRAQNFPGHQKKKSRFSPLRSSLQPRSIVEQKNKIAQESGIKKTRSPACRNYKPHYVKVARLFNGPNAVHPGIILMTRVDCAHKINTDLCDKFSVSHYPVVLWGPPIKFTAGKWDSKQENSGIVAIDDARTAERLLYWINKKIGSSFRLDDEKFENETSLSRNQQIYERPNIFSFSLMKIARAVYGVEETTANAFEIIVDKAKSLVFRYFA